jgi:hypothetical protein
MASGQRMTIGPLAPTDPTLPTMLQLDMRNGATLTRAEATTANGFYVFEVVPFAR